MMCERVGKYLGRFNLPSFVGRNVVEYEGKYQEMAERGIQLSFLESATLFLQSLLPS
jgi:hypothetical protein